MPLKVFKVTQSKKTKHWIGNTKIRDEDEEFDLYFKGEVPNDAPVRTQVDSDTKSESDNEYKINAMGVTGNVMAWQDCDEYNHVQFFKDDPGIFSVRFLTTCTNNPNTSHTIYKQAKKKLQNTALDNSWNAAYIYIK